MSKGWALHGPSSCCTSERGSPDRWACSARTPLQLRRRACPWRRTWWDRFPWTARTATWLQVRPKVKITWKLSMMDCRTSNSFKWPLSDDHKNLKIHTIYVYQTDPLMLNILIFNSKSHKAATLATIVPKIMEEGVSNFREPEHYWSCLAPNVDAEADMLWVLRGLYGGFFSEHNSLQVSSLTRFFCW